MGNRKILGTKELGWFTMLRHFFTAKMDRYVYINRVDFEEAMTIVGYWSGRVIELESQVNTLKEQNSSLLGYVTFPFISDRVELKEFLENLKKETPTNG